ATLLAMLVPTMVILGFGGTPSAWVIGLALLALAVIYVRRIGVEATPTGIRVYRELGSTLVAWAEIERFELDDVRPWPCWLVTTTGLRLKTWGLQPSPFVKHRVGMVATRSLVDSLNDLVQR